jgi:hypothetical protein
MEKLEIAEADVIALVAETAAEACDCECCPDCPPDCC